MLMSIDIEGTKFYGGFDSLTVKVPFTYYPSKSEKYEGVYVLDRTMDSEDRKIEWIFTSAQTDEDFDEMIIDKMDRYLSEYKFYNELLDLDLRFLENE